MTAASAAPARQEKPYQRFKAWQACHALALAVYRLVQSWPRVELYGLTAQARRSAFSAAANIAEGAGRRGSREFRRFLDISLGSLNELHYILLLSKDLGFTPPETWGEIEALRDHANQLTWGLCRAVGRKEAASATGA